MMAVNPLRKEVLGLYKRILRFGRSWVASNPSSTTEEKAYIQSEARFWFRKNSLVSDPQVVREHIQEAEARLEMASHYRNPYPRPVNLPPKTLTQKAGKKIGQVQEKMMEQSRPVYVKSIDHVSGLCHTKSK